MGLVGVSEGLRHGVDAGDEVGCNVCGGFNGLRMHVGIGVYGGYGVCVG